MAAAREGTQPLRYVPTLGLRLPAEGWVSSTRDGIVEGELEPGVWVLAAPLDEHALLAVVGPDLRLRGAAGASARQTLRSLVGGDPGWAGSGPIEPSELDAFLSQALVASLSYLSEDGYPSSVPLWYDWDGKAFWLVPSPAAEWAEYVRRNPRVSLSISESTPRSRPSTIPMRASGGRSRAVSRRATRGSMRRACSKAAPGRRARCCGWFPNS